jgi:hypothetical protein
LCGGLEKTYPKNQVIGVGLRDFSLAPTPAAPTAGTRHPYASRLGAMCARRVLKHMTSLKVTAFSPYSEHVSAATKMLGALSAFPVPATRADQVYFDRLMAHALRETADGLRELGWATGRSQDAAGLATCAGSVAAMVDRTSAPLACSAAADAIGTLRGASFELAVLLAAACALEGSSN